MRHLEGGCSVPLGVHTVFDEHTHVLSITGGVFSLNGAEKAKATVSAFRFSVSCFVN
jgi:hydroxymethylbilane synthase